MKKVLNFIKNNLVPVICGTIILLALLAWLVWPIPSMKDAFQEEINKRYNQAASAKQLVTTIQIPGGQPIPGATYEENVIAAAKHVSETMKAATDQITREAAANNLQGRVLIIDGRTVPLLSNIKEDNFLPKIVDRTITDPYAFKTDYEQQFKAWTTELVGNPDVVPQPPMTSEIQADLQHRNAVAVAPVNPMFSAPGATVAVDSATQLVEAEKIAVFKRAGSIHMYVDQNALQRRDWAFKGSPPNENQIFEALVDSWLQQDVIHAIVDANKPATNVSEAAVKRLERIIIGVTPSSPGGISSALFFNIGGVGGTSAAAANITPGTPDTTGTMTGRVSTPQADVVMLTIIADVDPAKQNRFIDSLYRQNNGYTVLNIRTSTVDPIDATSNGYIYGNTQCVHVEILVEAMLFRSWTAPLMPDLYRTQLGVAAPVAPVVPAPGAPGAPGAPPVPGA